MSKMFITGSSDGLGQLAAKQLIKEGHEVVLHARSKERAEDTKKAVPDAKALLIGDLSDLKEIKQLAAQANDFGNFDTVIHNAGVYNASSPLIFKINTLAPYMLSCLINKPKRLIYLSSKLHRQGKFNLGNLDPEKVSYGDSKLYVTILSKAIARLWTDVYANAVDPGWVPTKMGGSSAADDLEKGYQTQVWLATSNDAEAQVSGKYFYHKKEQKAEAEADMESKQNELLKVLEEMTGVSVLH